MRQTSSAAVFVDKDGTLIPDIPYNVDPERITLSPGAGAGMRRLIAAGFRIVVVSNQAGVARGLFPESALAQVEQRVRCLLQDEGVPLAGFYYCPHAPRDGCECRKPHPGMLRRAADDLCIDLGRSWLIGDIQTDIQAGQRAGCRTVLVQRRVEPCLWPPHEPLPDFVVPDLHLAAEAILECQCSFFAHRRTVKQPARRMPV